MNWFSESNIPITCAEPETNVGLFVTSAKSIAFARISPTIWDDDIFPLACERFICVEDDIIPSGNTAETLFTIMFTIDCDKVVSIDWLTISLTDAEKSAPVAAACCNDEHFLFVLIL